MVDGVVACDEDYNVEKYGDDRGGVASHGGNEGGGGYVLYLVYGGGVQSGDGVFIGGRDDGGRFSACGGRKWCGLCNGWCSVWCLRNKLLCLGNRIDCGHHGRDSLCVFVL